MLVGLPASVSDDDGKGKAATDGWGFDEEDAEVTDTDTSDEAEDNLLTLEHVSKKLFQSNASARKILATIGCALISEIDARGILERRIM